MGHYPVYTHDGLSCLSLQILLTCFRHDVVEVLAMKVDYHKEPAMNINPDFLPANNYQQTNIYKLPLQSRPKLDYNHQDTSTTYANAATNSQQTQNDTNIVRTDYIVPARQTLTYSLDEEKNIDLDMTDSKTGELIRHINFTGALLNVYVK